MHVILFCSVVEADVGRKSGEGRRGEAEAEKEEEWEWEKEEVVRCLRRVWVVEEEGEEGREGGRRKRQCYRASFSLAAIRSLMLG